MKLKNKSRDVYFDSAFKALKRAVLFTIIVVTVASFARGGEFELVNVFKATLFILISLAVLIYSAMFFIVKKSIQLGEVEDNGILFRKEK